MKGLDWRYFTLAEAKRQLLTYHGDQQANGGHRDANLRSPVDHLKGPRQGVLVPGLLGRGVISGGGELQETARHSAESEEGAKIRAEGR